MRVSVCVHVRSRAVLPHLQIPVAAKTKNSYLRRPHQHPSCPHGHSFAPRSYSFVTSCRWNRAMCYLLRVAFVAQQVVVRINSPSLFIAE